MGCHIFLQIEMWKMPLSESRIISGSDSFSNAAIGAV